MKITFTKRTLLALSAAGLISVFSGFMILRPSGSPGGYTGSPADGSTCGTSSSCHNTTATSVTGYITSNVPVSGYSPGQNYTITVTVPGASGDRKGFEVSPQNNTGTLLGVVAAGTGSKLVNSSKAVTHSSAVSTSPAVWTFSWTAPAKGTGPVTFYGAFVSGFSNVFKSTMTVSELTTSIENNSKLAFCCYPSPVNDQLNIRFYLEKKSNVRLAILTLDARKIADIYCGSMNQGNQEMTYKLKNEIRHGTFLLLMNVNGVNDIHKIVVE